MPGTLTGTLRIVLGDQCSRSLSALADLDPARDRVLMAEVMGECAYVKHHPKKIVLVLSAMRHFAQALGARGIAVDYIRLDDPGNTGTLRGEMLRAVARHRPERIVLTEPGEWRLLEDFRHWHDHAGGDGPGRRALPRPFRQRRRVRLPRHRGRRAAGAGRFRAAPAARVRRLSGHDEGRRGDVVPRPGLDLAQRRPAAAARSVPGGRGGRCRGSTGRRRRA